ncbi:MAG: deoxyguanosinetriphosphate triphosphohydrolase [Peptococcaceae bacterium]|nr:deoxyguanosinetriphosphate triphosphohydrolase [Peptococcaceae bacterium]
MIRQRAEETEKNYLSTRACYSSNSRGRVIPEEECSVRMAFQRDRDRIIHSKSFRRLEYKTQVFSIPEGDHYRTRLTHTLEVAQIARTIARALLLNEDLTEAIALGHDLGHTPFGHAGEDALNQVFSPGFKHNEHSLRVVDVLEKGTGLNLTFEVRDGILNHTGDNTPVTLEGQIVKIADRVAYINHDIDDAIRGGILSREQLPKDCLEVLGAEHRERINNMIIDLIKNNRDSATISMTPAFFDATNRLRNFLFDNVYIGSRAKNEESKAKHVITSLFALYNDNDLPLPEEFLDRIGTATRERIVCDYIAGMTDRYAIRTYQKYFLPVPWVE